MLTALFPRERSIGSVPWHNDSGWGFWPGDSTGPVWSGANVTEESATQLLAVYGSASLITDDISTLPVNIDNAPRPAWVDQPSEGVDRLAFIGQNVWSLLLAGGSYIGVLRSGGQVVALESLDPNKCDRKLVNGRPTNLVNGQVPPFQVLYIPGRMRPGSLVGMSPVEWCRQSIGLGLAAQKYGAQFFDGEGNMPGVIQAPGQLQPETKKNWAQQWREKRMKGGRGLPGVLDGGATWVATGITNEQAQFLATRKYTAAEIAGQMFLLDPSDLGIPVEGSNLTYANLQQREQRRTRIADMPWIRRIESALSTLIPGGEYRFDVDAHLRGNTRESYETLAVVVDAGIMTMDEAREILGLRPLDPVEVDFDDTDDDAA
jgi:HK97 family phage portal protein